MAPLDLTKLRPRLNEKILVDLCEVWRDVEGSGDDVADPATGSIVPATDWVKVHTTSCKMRAVFRGVTNDESGQPQVIVEYEVAFPGGIADIKAGDALKVTMSVHDPTVVGKWLRVSERLHGTLTLFTKVRAEMRERALDRP